MTRLEKFLEEEDAEEFDEDDIEHLVGVIEAPSLEAVEIFAKNLYEFVTKLKSKKSIGPFRYSLIQDLTKES